MGANNRTFSAPSTGLHEIMHMFGLSDRYTDVTRVREDGTKYIDSVPHEGFKNDIMGRNYCNPVSQVHWNNWGNYIMKNGIQSGTILNVSVDTNPDGTLK